MRAWSRRLVAALPALVAAMLDGGGEDCVYLAANSHWEGHTLELPAPPARPGLAPVRRHHRASPMDAYDPGDEPPLADQSQVGSAREAF